MIKKLMTLGIIFVFVPMAFGQQEGAAKQLTLQDCIDIALHRNTTVLQSQYQSQGQSARLLSAYGQLLPSVSATGDFSYQYNEIKSGVQVGGVIIPLTATAISRRYSASVGANYTLFDGMANFAGLDLVKSQSASTSLTD